MNAIIKAFRRGKIDVEDVHLRITALRGLKTLNVEKVFKPFHVSPRSLEILA